jgi:murein DD-endopeptidase MepM/ murein hydrolase activator NlpD
MTKTIKYAKPTITPVPIATIASDVFNVTEKTKYPKNSGHYTDGLTAIKDMTNATMSQFDEETGSSENISEGQGTGKLGWPMPGTPMNLTSPFGKRESPGNGGSTDHKGADFSAPSGTKVVAAEAGTVVFAGWYGSGGNTIIIKHSKDLYTLYMHASGLIAKKGNKVKKGDVIMKVGSTGASTGPHLHFGVCIGGYPYRGGTFVDPVPYLKT